MAQPKPTPEPVVVPEALKPLVEQLANLSGEDRHRVVEAAEHAVRGRRFQGVSLEDLRRLTGLVAIGGNALEDCDALYDG
ncbi:MAG: hypothetical protein IPI67_32855 [Myxococcales bacterium]|nr:hypothetical protein [Myxococcales bacterium]